MNNYPIILAHGIARFDFLMQRFAKDLSILGVNFILANDGLHYFKGIARHLRENGFDIYQSSVSFAAGVERRAADLKREIETALALRPEQKKVHIIAHSMGGLDARQMIINLEMAEKVASLTTIGTPHMGTSFADWGFAHEGNMILEVLGGIIDLGGFADLTTQACDSFNRSAERSEAANEVVYQTYFSSESKKDVFGLLQPSWQIIADREGDNDGLVPITSQKWQSELTGAGGVRKPIIQREFPISADHLNEVGWWDLNQLKISELAFNDMPSIVKNYEDRIKNVYLEIARDVKNLS